MLNLNYKKQKYIILVSFLVIPLLLLAAFSYYPAGDLIYLSFHDWDGVSPIKKWIGLANYIQVFTDPTILPVFLHNMVYFLGGIFQNIVALYFAIVLNTKLRGRNIFRSILFLPFVMNGVAVAFIFLYIYDTQNGAINLLLKFLGDNNYEISWLGKPYLVNFALAFVSMWKSMGFCLVVYLGALQSIPSEMYEAAKLDGASAWQTVIHITLPNIRSIIELNMFLTLAGSLEIFDIPFVMTKGGPLSASDTFVTKTITTAFTYSSFGLASAMGIVLLMFVIVMVSLQKMIIRKGDSA